MTDAELTARLRTNLIAFKKLQCAYGRVRHAAWPGVDAFAVPSQRELLNVQQVVYAEPGALVAALPALTDHYRGLGILRWRVSVPAEDTEVARVLEGQGYRPGEPVPAMGVALADLPATPPGVPVEDVETLADVAALNALAYGEVWRELVSAWEGPPRMPVHTVVAREGGRGLSCGVALDVGDTAGVYLVATAPGARGRGLASAVMHGLLAGARARGMAASVLQATADGHRVYQHLGYRDLGVWVNWEAPAD